MRITQVESHLLRVPLARPITVPVDGAAGSSLDHVFYLVVYLDTDAGHRGLGLAYAIGAGSRALKVVVDDDLAPLVIGEDPLEHERLAAKVARRLLMVGARGLVGRAYSAVDVALWDLKGKIAGLPLYKLLGGARESAPAYASDCGWRWMTPEDIVEAARPYLEQGMMGIQIEVGGIDPDADADRITRVREALGDDVWLGVDANQRYDYGTALSMGHFFEEEMGVDWFDNPLSADDLDGHARLADKLETPIAVGAALESVHEFRRYLEWQAVQVMRPDVTRLGGITPLLKLAGLADIHHTPVSPHLLPEIGVQLACALPRVQMVEYVPWLSPALVEAPALVRGHMAPPRRAGLGLEIRSDALQKYRVAE